MKKLKVLFFAEGATLAHVARPLVLAKGLDPELFNVVLCRPKSFSWMTVNSPFTVIDLKCQDGSVFAQRLESGAPLYDFETLCNYVEADLGLIDREKPDVIIGDFRISLSVSARLRSIPYITICDAYWSPERPLKPQLPVMKFTRFTPIKLSEFFFRHISPLAFRIHARPLEHLRAKYHLPSLGYDLRRCYTDADLRLFANFPALFPDAIPHPGANFIGPIAWSPDFIGDVVLPSGNNPLIYVTMGSSGNPHLLEKIIPALEDLDSRIVVTTAGKKLTFKPKRSSTLVFDFLPGSTICQQANLVICNGGSPTTNQALSSGVPVIGIAQNMDQFLNMDAIVAAGAGYMMRGDRIDQLELRKQTSRLIYEPSFSTAARRLAETILLTSPCELLVKHINSLCK